MGGVGSLATVGGKGGERRRWCALLPGRGAPLWAFVSLPSLLALASVVFDLPRLAGLLERAVAIMGGSVKSDDVVLVVLVVVETVGLESVAVEELPYAVND